MPLAPRMQTCTGHKGVGIHRCCDKQYTVLHAHMERCFGHLYCCRTACSLFVLLLTGHLNLHPFISSSLNPTPNRTIMETAPASPTNLPPATVQDPASAFALRTGHVRSRGRPRFLQASERPSQSPHSPHSGTGSSQSQDIGPAYNPVSTRQETQQAQLRTAVTSLSQPIMPPRPGEPTDHSGLQNPRGLIRRQGYLRPHFTSSAAERPNYISKEIPLQDIPYHFDLMSHDYSVVNQTCSDRVSVDWRTGAGVLPNDLRSREARLIFRSGQEPWQADSERIVWRSVFRCNGACVRMPTQAGEELPDDPTQAYLSSLGQRVSLLEAEEEESSPVQGDPQPSNWRERCRSKALAVVSYMEGNGNVMARS